MSITMAARDAFDYILKEKIKAAAEPSPTTHLGRITRIDEYGTYWVHILGGAEETPIRNMAASAEVGDTVTVTMAGNSADGTGNVTSPSAQVRQLIDVRGMASQAIANSLDASMAASEAESAAGRANNAAELATRAAENAVNDADQAYQAAQTAIESATNSLIAATQADRSANNALYQLSTVNDVVDTLNWVTQHGTYSPTTDISVDPTKVYWTPSSITSAYDPVTPDAEMLPSCYEAHLTTDISLVDGKIYYVADPDKPGSYIQVSSPDVADISNYYEFELTEDEAVVAGKTYYRRSESIGDYTIVDEPIDADISNYYELSIDQGLANYVAMHLALTDQGLSLVKDQDSYRVLITNESLNIIDPTGATVSTFGESISFDSLRPQRIGNDEVYVEFYSGTEGLPPDSLRIAATSFTLVGENGNVDLYERMQSVDADIDEARRTATDYLSYAYDETEGKYALSLASSEDSDIKSVLTNTKFAFKTNAGDIAYFGLDSNSNIWQMFIDNASITDMLHFGQFAWITRANGNMSLKWMGE